MAKRSGYLYKYLPENLAGVVFTRDNQVTLKFSKPEDFNDPYELFLATDFGGDSEMLACYAEAIGELPQFPTTCFSHSPIVIPMWAHYAFNHSGFVIEFSEDSILKHFEDAKFDDVSYTDSPSHDFSDLVSRVLDIGKPRYTYFLRSAVVRAAYFNKATCWDYEQERRMIVGNEDVMISGDLMLMNIPQDCVSSIICGARTTDATKTLLQEISDRLSVKFYELRIGRSSAVPYLVDRTGTSYSFIDDGISPSDNSCASCSEPIDNDKESCAWCQITDDTRLEVARRNPYRILDHLGGLEDYIAQMNAVGRDDKRK